MNSEDVLLGMLVGVRWGARQADLGDRIGSVRQGPREVLGVFLGKGGSPTRMAASQKRTSRRL
jgi:hypothetical protein